MRLKRLCDAIEAGALDPASALGERIAGLTANGIRHGPTW